ncbi:sensor domain-containing diguanylate cyclase [Lelliottia nimipressuralis]|uniref:Sensor domain-containing diguanylate cyclase n=1 Tax=Lelliottia nimipressuralis TaxID=69220 RepID=A0ABD4K7I0_9ENTR|nr:sensor domain-containing diguanylate cyclase [Lelliottia nimipressuralis]MBF4177105.1 sensor domain-containing diguanylate cyclase [Lelliottia nimipressuralis]
MKAPAIPANESDRLLSLRDSRLLESNNHQPYDRITRLAKRLFAVPVARVNLIDERSLVALSLDNAMAAVLPRNLSFCGHTLFNNAPLVVSDPRHDPRFADNPLVKGQPGVRFYAGYPLRLPDGAIVGTLCLMDYVPRDFVAADLNALSDLAALAEDEFAAACAATTDELTGLFNRRGFNQLAAFALSGARRRAEPLTLAWMDLDRFRQINELYGQAEGDAALKAMTELMRTSFRDADLLVRYGSDEFAVLFADTDEQGAWIAMQYLNEQVAEYNQRGLHPWSLTFSWGICEFDHQQDDLQRWLQTAHDKILAMKQRYSADSGHNKSL